MSAGINGEFLKAIEWSFYIKMEEEKWYTWACNTKTYLHHKRLYMRSFPTSNGDHVHCEVCWARISNLKGDANIAYYEPIYSNWICIACAKELRAIFDWTIIDEPTPNN